MKEREVVFVIKNCLTKEEIECEDFIYAEILLEKERKLKPRAKLILLCKVR